MSRTWPTCWSGSGSGRWGSSPRSRSPRRATGSARRACSRTGSPAGSIRGRSRRATPAADLSVQIEFDPPAEQAERVVFAAKALASQMHAQLAASGLACVRVQIQVRCDNGEEISRLWRHDGLLSELAVAERVRWQLDGWRAGRPADEARRDPHGPGDEGIAVGGISLLRLVPDQLVVSQGRQLGLWGDAVVTDRVARAAIRVQAMLGHQAVRQPVLTGGRSPSDQAVLVPFGDCADAAIRPADRPWPGRIPPPAPATVYPVPRQAAVTDGSGSPVTVTGTGTRVRASRPGCRSRAARRRPSRPGPGRGRSPSAGGIPSTPAGRPGSSWSPPTAAPGSRSCRTAAG